jgi:hypothetical protein
MDLHPNLSMTAKHALTILSRNDYQMTLGQAIFLGRQGARLSQPQHFNFSTRREHF